MILDIRYRCVYLLFVEKELNVLLVNAIDNTYQLPETSNLVLAKDGQYAEHLNRMPYLPNSLTDKKLTIDYYILNKTSTVVQVPQAGKWFTVQEAITLNPQTASLLTKTLKQLRKELHYNRIASFLLPELFTMLELFSLYEIILNKTLNRGNFYRKMMRVGILTVMGIQKTGKAHKSPLLYTFNDTYFNHIEDGLFQEF